VDLAHLATWRVADEFFEPQVADATAATDVTLHTTNASDVFRVAATGAVMGGAAAMAASQA
jgi:hypothetical protein